MNISTDDMTTKDFFNRRCKDLNDQNSLLHQHLESVSTHAARIKQAASSTAAESGEAEATDDADTKVTELRSLVTYLRKEKEIIELQLELSKQENTRLKTQIDHLSQNLDDTRRALSEVGLVWLELCRFADSLYRSVNVPFKQPSLRSNTTSLRRRLTKSLSSARAMPPCVVTARRI